MEHTKLPWRVAEFCDHEIEGFDCVVGATFYSDNKTEDAAFIVKACNNHENLINTLRAAETELSSGEITLTLINTIIIMARQAIKEAEE